MGRGRIMGGRIMELERSGAKERSSMIILPFIILPK